MFLVNAQPEAPYRILEWVLDAIVRAGGKGAFFATERYRGIALLNRNR